MCCTFVVTLYVMYVSIVHTCFLGSSTVTNRSLVSPSKSSSNCSLLRRDEEEAGLDVSTGVPLGRLRSCFRKEKNSKFLVSEQIHHKVQCSYRCHGQVIFLFLSSYFQTISAAPRISLLQDT